MTKPRTGAERYLSNLKTEPEFRTAYEQAAHRITAVDRLVRALENARVDKGLTKAELARRAGMQPEAVRRLFTVDRPNPTATTLAALAQVLDLELVAKPASPSQRRIRTSRVKLRRRSEVRLLTGSGYPAGDMDISQAGPIPAAAGVKKRPRVRTARRS